MRFTVEPSPSGGYFVRLAGVDAPVSRHDTEEEAEAAAASYDRGVRENRVGDLQRLPDGREVLVRAVRAEDKPLFARGWEHFGQESRYRRFMGVKQKLSTSELSFFTEIDHIDHEAIGALDPESGEGLGVARLDERHQVLVSVKQVLSAPITHAPILLAAELERFYISVAEEPPSTRSG